jgi:hypothetical protein
VVTSTNPSTKTIEIGHLSRGPVQFDIDLSHMSAMEVHMHIEPRSIKTLIKHHYGPMFDVLLIFSDDKLMFFPILLYVIILIIMRKPLFIADNFIILQGHLYTYSF